MPTAIGQKKTVYYSGILMKNSKKYAQKIDKLYRSLKRKYPKTRKINYDEPTQALVYGIINENFSPAAAQAAITNFAVCFVDLNDLRVSLIEEITEALGKDTPSARTTAALLKSVLNVIFNKYHFVSLQALKKIGKRPARQALEKIEGASAFAIDYCALTSLRSHAVPITKKMIEFLKNNELVHPQAKDPDIAGFLSRQISAENAYDFYSLLRLESESDPPPQKKKIKKSKTKKKTKTKTRK